MESESESDPETHMPDDAIDYRVTFVREDQRPGVRTGNITATGPPYIKTPYPGPDMDPNTLESPPESPIDCHKKIYDLSTRYPLPKPWLSANLSDFFQTRLPSEVIRVNCTCSELPLNRQWEPCLPHPLLRTHNPPRFVFAQHVYVEFPSDSSSLHRWGEISQDLRDRLSDYDMSNAAIEFVCRGEYETISAWYPPTVDQEMLKTYFKVHFSESDSEEDEEADGKTDEEDGFVKFERWTIPGKQPTGQSEGTSPSSSAPLPEKKGDPESNNMSPGIV
ncbi:hypothetical protein F4777DRAFT_576392 [Nemania sp. FL0916]|nr:hypothetical protein F4777DRAFT_576392 [Nemania sp. FL0916]